VENVEKVRNHIGQVHAAAMILLAETVTGIVVGMNIPDDKIPLIKSLNTRFVRRTEGRITAAATLTDAQIQHIETVDKGDVPVAVTVTDATGEEVILVEAVWAWIPKRRN
jgi:acyl-coenzyme A thioesterase PaaI-like protein